MPSRHVLKTYAPDSYYWVANAGLNGQEIFRDIADYNQLLQHFRRHLSHDEAADRLGRKYEKLFHKTEVLTYCLLPNALQLVIYQYDADGLPGLMRRVMTGYTMYFNRRHGRTGPLFQNRYKAVQLKDPMDILKVSRYVHLKPLALGQDIAAYPFSGLPYVMGRRHSDWLRPDRILFAADREQIDYHAYMANYTDYTAEQELLSERLADR